MQVKINNEYYSALKNLSFSPETDIVNNSLAINEFSVDIVTDDTISVSTQAELYDEVHVTPWFAGMIVYAERLQADIVTIRVQSWFRNLDMRTMDPEMYANEPLDDILDDIFGSTPYRRASSLSGLTLSGYVPEQTARERLQWVCLCIGAFVRSYGAPDILIWPLADSTNTIIPVNKTFWKPSVTYGDYVEKVTVTAYSFTQRTPQSGEESVEVDGITYVVTKQDYSTTNPNLPSGIVGKTIKVSDVSLINENNFSDILINLTELYFNRITVDIDVINNRDYFPGDMVQFFIDEGTMAVGYIESCNYHFGLQARSRMRIKGVEDLDSAPLIINYLYNDRKIDKRKYRFPIGYEYEIDNIYPDIMAVNHRYIYRPENEQATGTIVSGTNVDNEDCSLALHFYIEGSVLEIISVDSVAETEPGSGIIVIK